MCTKCCSVWTLYNVYIKCSWPNVKYIYKMNVKLVEKRRRRKKWANFYIEWNKNNYGIDDSNEMQPRLAYACVIHLLIVQLCGIPFLLYNNSIRLMKSEKCESMPSTMAQKTQIFRHAELTLPSSHQCRLTHRTIMTMTMKTVWGKGIMWKLRNLIHFDWVTCKMLLLFLFHFSLNLCVHFLIVLCVRAGIMLYYVSVCVCRYLRCGFFVNHHSWHMVILTHTCFAIGQPQCV